jgi:hypothetical protein
MEMRADLSERVTVYYNAEIYFLLGGVPSPASSSFPLDCDGKQMCGIHSLAKFTFFVLHYQYKVQGVYIQAL